MSDSIPVYDRDAIFNPNGPFNPCFMREAIRAMVRTLSLDPAEPQPWQDRRMYSALLGLSALHPRDEIEVMLGVQAMSAYHAAAACWHLGMNLQQPSGDSTRHISAACSAARTFDTMLRALERRQAKPSSVPVGRPAPQPWPATNPGEIMNIWEDSCRNDDGLHPAPQEPAAPAVPLTEQEQVAADALAELERIKMENEGLDIANTEGILPGGGMIVMEHPTPQQAAYLGRRLGLSYRREYAENQRKGSDALPKIRAIRPGDLIL